LWTPSTGFPKDRANKIVILTGAGGDFMIGVDWQSFKDVSDPGVWSQIHDEGVQVLENMVNIRVPVIAAIEGRAHIHSEYALLANVIVAAEGATFQDVGHFAAGVVPGDGIFTAWSYRAGAGRAEAFLLNPQPLTAAIAQQWGVVAEIRHIPLHAGHIVSDFRHRRSQFVFAAARNEDVGALIDKPF
jgi:enoyl-CoA hydratase/carnithine racemase